MTPETLDPQQQRIYSAITGGPRAQGPQHFRLVADDGCLTGPFNAFLLSPGVGHVVQELGSAIRFQSQLSDRAREIAILVAAAWESTFERDSHEAIAVSVGLERTELDALHEHRFTALQPADRLVAEVTNNLLNGDLSDEQWAAATATLSHEALFELTTLVGYYGMLALQLRVFRVEQPPHAA